MENEYIKKQYGFEIKATSELDDYLRIEAFASTFGNLDRHDDIMDRGAFTETVAQLKKEARNTPLIEGTNFQALLPALFQHDTDDPVGVIVSFKINDQGLLVTILLPKNDTKVAGKIIPQLTVRSIKSLSIGGFITKRMFDEETGVRTILRFELMEISLVTIPANPAALITSVKSEDNKGLDLPIASLPTKWNEQLAFKRIQKAGFLKEGSMEISDLSYEFDSQIKSCIIFSDIIDGELSVIPRAVFSGAAKLAGIKNHNLLPKEKIESAKETLIFYYKKMGRANPFECGFSPSELNAATPEEMKGIFRNGTRFSKAGAEYVQEAIFASSKRADKIIPNKGAEFKKRLKEIINSHSN